MREIALVALLVALLGVLAFHRTFAAPVNDGRTQPLGAEFSSRRLGEVTKDVDLWELRIRHPGTDVPRICYGLVAGSPSSMAGVKPSLSCP